MLYEVYVGNIGLVHSGKNKRVAMRVYSDYLGQSRRQVGRAGGEEVTLFADGDPILNYCPAVRLCCNQCLMVSINGVACHESGCPNQGSRWDNEREEWIKQVKCHCCGYMRDIDEACCVDDMEDFAFNCEDDEE